MNAPSAPGAGPARPPEPRRATNQPQRGKKRLANGLVALSSAAVIAVYAAGYARTAPAAEQASAAAFPTLGPTVGTAPSPTPTSTATATAAPTSTSASAPIPGGRGTRNGGPGGQVGGATGGAAVPTATATATATPASGGGTAATTAATAAFRDGTYNGTGTSRHGSIGVAVTIAGGKITSAEITDCGTRYPCSRIAALPGQVVARQSAAVDLVSGATDSTNAYRAAVNAALAQARAQ